MHAVALTQFVSLHSNLQALQCEIPNRNVSFQTGVSRRGLGEPTIRRRVSKAYGGSIRAAVSANPVTRGTDGEEESIQRSEAITNVDVVVIGAGIGGLCCAALLAKYGYKVVVCESHDIAGGAGHAFERQGFQFDSGPSFHAGLSIKPSINPLKQVFMLSVLRVPGPTELWFPKPKRIIPFLQFAVLKPRHDDSGPSFHARLAIKPSIKPLKQICMLSALKLPGSQNLEFRKPRETSNAFNLR
jgi:hypothetical protein